ncbi:F0F1 ATP synthase subunit B [Acidiferrimicrobium sp. IK]|uniref:F0F1 ATP synthase subunit B n=1 Tax=Acidiferrimicrobium sp. IK TaxID=2871700 RepID=UPI0021CB5F46|nr:F0F1 ATP synthase subunit B [Acidiferrimicrobium sp. IK]MCU4186490.1 F0F1 ATP synthase subunit B [Acidiferrimicrobium sp. IK]
MLFAAGLVAATQKVDCSAAGISCQNAQSKNPILPTVPEIVWGTLAFVVLFVVLWKLALPPLVKLMRDRTERIANDLSSAEQARVEAQQTLEDYKRELAEARSEASHILDEARQAAEQVRQDLMARAEAEAAELRARNDSALQAAQERVLGELEGQVREVALDLAEKVVGANLDRDTNLALIDRFIDELNAGPTSDAGAALQ